MRQALILDGARTPRGKGKPGGALHEIHPQELLAQVLNALPDRTGVQPTDVEDVVVGNAENAGDHGACIGRLAMLHAGWPVTTPGMTINRYCGSGQQAATFAAMGIMSGHQDVVVAAGVESMSRSGAGGGDREPTMIGRNQALGQRFPIVPQGISADAIATLEGFRREDVDAFGVTSQDRAEKAMADGAFDRSLITVTNSDGSVALDREEFPRPGTTLEALAGLTPSFAKMGAMEIPGFPETFDEMIVRHVDGLDGVSKINRVEHVHHGGNSSGVVDGAAATVIVSDEWAKAHGVRGRARFVATATGGADPVLMLTAPTPATRKVLAKAGMAVGDIDLFEINEAFAAVPLKTMRDLGIDPDKVNVNGGAIALGHPIGATGVMLLQTIVDELERRDLSTGLVVMCTGGGMGTATIIERI